MKHNSSTYITKSYNFPNKKTFLLAGTVNTYLFEKLTKKKRAFLLSCLSSFHASMKFGNAADPTELKPLAVAYEELTAVLPSTTELTNPAEADQTARMSISEFQQLLSPDSRLRNMIHERHCDLCPPITGPL